MLRNFHRPFGLAILASFSLVFLGCGEAGPARIPGGGTVTFEGKPLSKANISFLPISGSGPSANGEIVNGEYNFTEVNGPTQGPHKVIVAVTPTSKFSAPAAQTPHGENEFQFDVPASGPFKKDFKFEQH